MARKIEVEIVGQDRGLHSALQSAERATGSFGSSLGNLAKSAALTAGAAGIGALVGGIGLAIHAAADFEQSLNIMQAVSGATGDQMKKVSALAKDLGRDIKLPGTSAKDAADAMTELAKGGLSVKESMSAARGVLQLSAAAQISNADAATITARALNSFGLSGKEAVRVADLLAAASNASTAEISDLALGMSAASAVFKMGNQSIDDLTASLALMANAGISGSDAGTSLKTMMLSLEAPTKLGAAAMDDLGIKVRDAHGHMLPMRDLVEIFTKKLSGLSDAQRDAALKTIFGTDAIRAANIVLAAGVDKWDKMREAVEKQGASAELAAAKVKGFKGALEGFQSAFQGLLIDIGTPLLAAATTAAGALSDVVGWLDKIANAKDLKTAIHITVEGLEAAKQKLDELLFGKTITIRGMDFGGMEQVHTQGLVDKISSALQRVDWAGFGRAIARGIESQQETWNEKAFELGHKLGAKLNEGSGKGANDSNFLSDGIKFLFSSQSSSPAEEFGAGMGKSIRDHMGKQFGSIKAEATRIGKGITDGVKFAADDVPDKVRDILHKLGGVIKGWVGSAFAFAVEIGRAIVGGIMSGLGNLASAVGAKIGEGISGAIGAAKSALRIHSPSEVTRDELGRPLAEGVIVGWGDKIVDLAPAIIRSFDGIMAEFRGHAYTIMDVIGRGTAKSFGDGFLNGLSELASNMSQAIASLLDQVWRANFEAFRRRIMDDVRGIADNLGGSLAGHPVAHVVGGAGGGSQGKFPGLATGGFVTGTGLALVHKGETVIPAGRGAGDTYNLYFPNYVGSEDDLRRVILSVNAKSRSRGGLGI